MNDINSSKVIFLTLIALAAGTALELFGIKLYFIDMTSIVIVVGGTFGAGIFSYGINDIRNAISDAISYKSNGKQDFEAQLLKLIKISKVAKNQGPLSLEKLAKATNDSLLRKGLQLIADSTSSEKIRHTLEIESRLGKSQIQEQITILSSLAAIAPALGLIGTVIGLVQMLSGITDSETLGQGMSVALLTTLYGAVLSYLVLQPLAIKLEKKLRDKEILDELTQEGIEAIEEGLSPQLIEERLSPFAA